DLMDEIAVISDNAIKLNRSGYLLASRNNTIDDVYGLDQNLIREYSDKSISKYSNSLDTLWSEVPDAIDVLQNRAHIQQLYPHLSSEISSLIHIRKAGDLDGQALGQFMLQAVKTSGAAKLRYKVTDIQHSNGFQIALSDAQQTQSLHADYVINAAGPFAHQIANMLGQELPLENLYQQKILFADEVNAVPRTQPFVIDIDKQHLDWTEEERALLEQDPDSIWLTREIGGSVHCRPEGGDKANWVKLGWAYNTRPSEPAEDLMNDTAFDPSFPEIVIRGASNLNPALKHYLDKMPSKMTHYGGYYCMTEENWPLIGPLGVENAFVVGALSGFGTMAACAAGELCANWVLNADLADYAKDLSLYRYSDEKLMKNIRTANKGVL
ncbi:MAG: FAD-binding oxidoreductase, partial [Gammaproteobacteria bacterium]|nr:FAD-binding oxidoreductase [Gammaproteobacteria bacterium]